LYFSRYAVFKDRKQLRLAEKRRLTAFAVRLYKKSKMHSVKAACGHISLNAIILRIFHRKYGIRTKEDRPQGPASQNYNTNEQKLHPFRPAYSPGKAVLGRWGANSGHLSGRGAKKSPVLDRGSGDFFWL